MDIRLVTFINLKLLDVNKIMDLDTGLRHASALSERVAAIHRQATRELRLCLCIVPGVPGMDSLAFLWSDSKRWRVVT